MAKDTCKRHPELAAVAVCATCGIPICEQCRTLSSDGTFCGDECHAKFVKFNAAHPEAKNKIKRGGGFPLKWIVIVAVIVGLLAVLYIGYDVTSPADIPGALGEMWADVTGMF